jgi:hypothetical protein
MGQEDSTVQIKTTKHDRQQRHLTTPDHQHATFSLVMLRDSQQTLALDHMSLDLTAGQQPSKDHHGGTIYFIILSSCVLMYPQKSSSLPCYSISIYNLPLSHYQARIVSEIKERMTFD